MVLALWLYGSGSVATGSVATGSLATGSVALAQPVFFNDDIVCILPPLLCKGLMV